MALILVGLLVPHGLPVFAMTAEEVENLRQQYKEQLAKDPLGVCQQNIDPAFKLEQAEFLNFLNLNFQNKSSDSSLINIAISRYAEHKRNLKDLLAILQPGGTEGTGSSVLYADEVAAYSDCQKIMDAYIDTAKEEMIKHIRKNAAQKKTALMVEKYQAINDQLRELNVQIAKMYGLFMTFKEKLPGFLQECIR